VPPKAPTVDAPPPASLQSTVAPWQRRRLEIQSVIATLLKFSAMAINNSTFFLDDHLTLLPSYRVAPANKLTDQSF